MKSLTDQQLLRDYAEQRSEAAFAGLVCRHVDLVYSAALRMVRDAHLAEDVTQGVFVALAQNARQLTERPVLSGWLHRTAQNLAANAVRSEVRRRVREQEAAAMNEVLSAEPDASWEHIAPHLDAALGELSEPDRDAVLLRYFERKSAHEMAQTLGISDEAAQKRVSRAVERLRELFAERGITVGASGLAAVIYDNAVQAAPVGLAATICAAAALAALSIPAATGTGAAAGFFGSLMLVSRTKLAIGLAATVLMGVTTFVLLRPQRYAEKVANTDSAALDAKRNQPAAALATQDANAAGEEREPDPRKLLQGVALTRQRIASGAMELQISSEHATWGRKETNNVQLKALFDGQKLRCEEIGREYAYKYSEDEAERDEITKRADSMDREAAVRAGWLQKSEARYVTVWDGEALMMYRERNGQPEGTTIDEPGRSATFTFDPRCLGLVRVLYARTTIDFLVGFLDEAKSINLAGKEAVDGVPTWHVRVQSKHDEPLDFWIDVARPDRVLKHADTRGVVVSKYGGRNPIPMEVIAVEQRNGSVAWRQRFFQSDAGLHVPVDPSFFTLAGLGMPVGTHVTDVRNHRSLGYWTGIGLTDFPPPKATEPQLPPPNMADLLTLLDIAPASPDALNAAAWILLNTPDGPAVEKAAQVILRKHTRDTNLVYLCKELERARHRCSKPLLEAMLKDNPNADVRGTACFSLATMLKDEAKYGQNKKATADAEKHFERVIAEFGQVKQRGWKLEDLAKPELSELRRLTIGKPAPEIEGEDLDGQQMRLSDYRGNVVVLTFWGSLYIEAPEHRKLVERMAGKPFAFVGVYGEDDLAKGKEEIEKYGITWPSFRDKSGGPICTNWNVRGWPDVWVLDRQGIIRHRGVRGHELTEAVESLLRE